MVLESDEISVVGDLRPNAPVELVSGRVRRELLVHVPADLLSRRLGQHELLFRELGQTSNFGLQIC